jgi:hypothetical protein
MNRAWFKELGWVYRPASRQAWILTVLTVLFCVNVFMAVDRQSHSASDTLYGIFPYWVCALAILNWVAGKSCRRTQRA